MCSAVLTDSFTSSDGDEPLREGIEHWVERRRQSGRHRTPNKRFDGFYVVPQASVPSPDSNDPVSLCDDDETAALCQQVKATTLFEKRTDVAGGQVYGFRTPKKRHSLSVLAASVQHTPQRTPQSAKMPKTPRSAGKAEVASATRSSAPPIPTTPHQVRYRLKKCIAKLVNADSGSDFSDDSDSEYAPQDDDDDDEDLSDSDDTTDEENAAVSITSNHARHRLKNRVSHVNEETSDGSGYDRDDDDDEDYKGKGRKAGKVQVPTFALDVATDTGRRTRSSTNKTELQYVLHSDEYFSTHASGKSVTSDHTLDRLNTPRLQHSELFQLLQKTRSSEPHIQATRELHADHEGYFFKWMVLLNEGYNILLYGLGSKRQLLSSFHRKMLADKPALVVNGFFPALTLKEVLDAIAVDLLDLPQPSGHPHEVVDIIEREMRYLPDAHIFLLVHNLDGTTLRSGRTQGVLCRLANIANVHLVASVDHINAPLLWDSSTLSSYNFSWWDVTSMQTYTDETAFENSLLVQNSGALALSSMRNVYASLTSNARGIFLVIVRHQLANMGEPQYSGMPFKDLYWSCREAFLVSSDLSLRAQLTEFTDHRLVKIKRTIDGTENLTVPIERNLLQQFLEETDTG